MSPAKAEIPSMDSYDFDVDSAVALPHQVRLGTSSWTYPSWRGVIYREKYSEKEFNVASLKEYAQNPLFRTVGIDSSFYKPLSQIRLLDYTALLPQGFTWIEKIWERLTIPTFPSHPHYGNLGGKANPDFLSVEILESHILEAHRHEVIRRHAGPFVFQFPAVSEQQLTRSQFFFSLDTFVKRLPKDFTYATEVRNPEYLVKDYFDILNGAGVTHCFNHWNSMPRLRDQMRAAAQAGGLEAPFYVARLLTPLGMSYAAAEKLMDPYLRIVRPNEDLLADVERLAKRAIERNVTAYVVVNNKAEGNSPMTLDRIARRVTRSLSQPEAPEDQS